MTSLSVKFCAIGLIALALAARLDGEGAHAPEVRLTLQDGTVVEGRASLSDGPEGLVVCDGGADHPVRSSDIAFAAVPPGAGSTFVDCADPACKAIRGMLARCNASSAMRAVLRQDYASLGALFAEMRDWRDGPAFWRAVYGCGLLVATEMGDEARQPRNLRVARILADEFRAARGAVPEAGVSPALLAVAGVLHGLGKTQEARAPFFYWPLSAEEASAACDGLALQLGYEAVLAVGWSLEESGEEAPKSLAVAPELADLLEGLRAEADEDFERYFLAEPGAVYPYALEGGGTTRVSLSDTAQTPDGVEYRLLLEQAPAQAPVSRSIVTIVRAPYCVYWRLGDRLAPLSYLPCRVDTSWAWQLGEYEFVRTCAEVEATLTRGTNFVSPAIRFRQVSLRRPKAGAPIVVDTLQTYGPGCLLCDIEVLGREDRPVYTLEEGR